LRDWLRRGGKGFKTARNIIDGTLRAMYRDAVAEGVIPLPHPGQHPFETLKWKKREEDEPPPEPYTAEEREGLLGYFREHKRRYYALVVLLFWSGLRLSEAFGLQWRDVDFKRKRIVIRRSRTCGEDNAPKTKYSKREITPLPIVLEMLAAYRGKRFPNPTDHVFSNLRKKPLNDHGWMKDHWTPALEFTTIRHRPAYNTRHTFITHALLDGWTTHEVARYCGTSPRMIDEHYAGVIQSSLDEKMARMDATARLGTVPKAVSASEEK
jgi:integrase